MSILQVVLSGRCVAQTHLAWTKCCSQQSPDEARFRDGNFDRWDVDQAISVEWKMHHMLVHFLKELRAKWFEKSTDVGPVVRNGSRSPQRCGTRWRR